MEEKSLRLRFRMWNEGIKKMTYFDDPNLTFEAPNQRGDPPKCCVLAFHLAEGNALYFGNYKFIMQCVGICDKNKKPIYDEDIIEFYNTEGKILRKVITWNEKLLCYFVGNMPYDTLYNSAYIHRQKLLDCEVIGNSIENPELMESQND